MALAKNSEPDPANAFASPSAAPPPPLDLYDPAVAKLTPDALIARAIEAEKVARAADKKVTATQFAGAGRSDGETWIVNTKGVEWGFPETAVFNFIGVLAADEGGKQRGGNEGSPQRYLADLEHRGDRQGGGQARGPHGRGEEGAHAEAAGRDAPRRRERLAQQHVQRVLGRAGVQEGLVLDREAGPVGGLPLVTIVDDPFRKRALGGAPCDDEGVPAQKIVLLDKGVVKTFVYNMKWATKAGAKSTGHAARGYNSMPGIGSHSLYIENGTTPVDDLIKGLDVGFYLTTTGAFGYDPPPAAGRTRPRA